MNIYKSLSFLLFTLFSTFLFSCSCNEQKNKSEEIDSWETPIDIDTIIDLPQIKVTDTVTIKNTLYNFNYNFHAVDSLPIVLCFNGMRYHDNEVELSVYNDSSLVFKKNFRKNMFKDLIPEKDLKKMSLTNFNYFLAKREDHSKFHFLAIISDPEEGDNNYGYFIDIQIDDSGNIHMEKAKESDITTMPYDYDENNTEE